MRPDRARSWLPACRRGLCVLSLLGALVFAAPVVAQGVGEAALKARLVLSLSRFTQWPELPAGEPLRLCVAQRQAEVLQAFAALDGQTLNGRRVVVQKVPPLQGCQVLFVHASAERPAELLRGAAAGVLTVGDAEGFLGQGGMVELVVVNDAMRFDVNLVAVRQAQVGLSSQVLRLARRVREAAP